MDKDRFSIKYLNLEEYFSFEDYTTYKNYNFNTSSKNINESSVRVSFPKEKKEFIESKNNLKKVFAFFKIYSLDNNNNKENYIPLYSQSYYGIEYNRLLIYLSIKMKLEIIMEIIY